MATLEPGRLQNVGRVRVPSSVECRPLWHLSSLSTRKLWGSGNTRVHASIGLPFNLQSDLVKAQRRIDLGNQTQANGRTCSCP